MFNEDSKVIFRFALCNILINNIRTSTIVLQFPLDFDLHSHRKCMDRIPEDAELQDRLCELLY